MQKLNLSFVTFAWFEQRQESRLNCHLSFLSDRWHRASETKENDTNLNSLKPKNGLNEKTQTQTPTSFLRGKVEG